MVREAVLRDSRANAESGRQTPERQQPWTEAHVVLASIVRWAKPWSHGSRLSAQPSVGSSPILADPAGLPATPAHRPADSAPEPHPARRQGTAYL